MVGFELAASRIGSYILRAGRGNVPLGECPSRECACIVFQAMVGFVPITWWGGGGMIGAMVGFELTASRIGSYILRAGRGNVPLGECPSRECACIVSQAMVGFVPITWWGGG